MEPLVATVMRRQVTTVGPQTGFQQIARLLVTQRISAVPVVDTDRHVLGIVSADDLLNTRPRRFHYSQRASHVALGRAAGRVAAEVMSAPALVIRPEGTVAKAAELMHTRHVKRLAVVDEERRLVGIVARSDVLEAYLERWPAPPPARP